MRFIFTLLLAALSFLEISGSIGTRQSTIDQSTIDRTRQSIRSNLNRSKSFKSDVKTSSGSGPHRMIRRHKASGLSEVWHDYCRQHFRPFTTLLCALYSRHASVSSQVSQIHFVAYFLKYNIFESFVGNADFDLPANTDKKFRDVEDVLTKGGSTDDVIQRLLTSERWTHEGLLELMTVDPVGLPDLSVKKFVAKLIIYQSEKMGLNSPLVEALCPSNIDPFPALKAKVSLTERCLAYFVTRHVKEDGGSLSLWEIKGDSRDMEDALNLVAEHLTNKTLDAILADPFDSMMKLFITKYERDKVKLLSDFLRDKIHKNWSSAFYKLKQEVFDGLIREMFEAGNMVDCTKGIEWKKLMKLLQSGEWNDKNPLRSLHGNPELKYGLFMCTLDSLKLITKVTKLVADEQTVKKRKFFQGVIPQQLENEFHERALRQLATILSNHPMPKKSGFFHTMSGLFKKAKERMN